MLCGIDIKDLQNDKNYNALYGDATPNTKKFWDISNLPKYDFVALYIKSKYTPYIELAAAMMSLCACTYTFILFDFDLEIIKLNPSNENYLELLNMAKNDETFIDNYNKLKTDN